MKITEVKNLLEDHLTEWQTNTQNKLSDLEDSVFNHLLSETCQYINLKTSSKLHRTEIILPNGQNILVSNLNILDVMAVHADDTMLHQVTNLYENTEVYPGEVSAFNLYENNEGNWVFIFNAYPSDDCLISVWHRKRYLNFNLLETRDFTNPRKTKIEEINSVEFDDRFIPAIISVMMYKITKDKRFFPEDQGELTELKKIL
ncbi:MAG: hypothetical protein IAE91_04220 [Ignavibacteriaceae bacterium]|nr:hypothetical protein [Ignavibacteriaceae bacterium]